MDEPFNKKNVAEMADRAAEEIERLRRVNSELAPRAHAYDTITTILGLLPQQSQGYGEDLAWKLRKRAKELRAPEAEAEDGA